MAELSQVSANKLFGGCLSVLTNLIGTPYLPASFAEQILFFEDIGEHPGKILRYLNQWYQAGLFAKVHHIVLGDFNGLDSFGYDKQSLCKEVYERTKITVSSSSKFGHCSPNYPLGVGYWGQISSNSLSWNRSNQNGPQA